MATGFDVIRSTDVGAAVLTGEAGSLNDLLRTHLTDWAEVYTSGEISVWRAGTGNRYYLQVDDSGGMTGGFRDAAVRAYATMSDAVTGTSPTPTIAQRDANTYNVRKSDTADATARAWVLFKTDKFFHLRIQHQATSQNGFCFGDVLSFVPGDSYNAFIAANPYASKTATLSGGGTDTFYGSIGLTVGAVTTATIYWLGSRTALGSVAGGLYAAITSSGVATDRPYNASEDGGPEMMPLMAQSSDGTSDYFIRSRIPGVWNTPYTSTSFATNLAGNTWQGTGDLAGYEFEAATWNVTSSHVGALETSNSPDLL